MNSKSTWFWACVAVALFAFIFFFERHQTHEEHPAAKTILSGVPFQEITALSVIPENERAIRVQRTNGSWQLTQPVVYPAQATNVENLLAALENLTSAPPITAAELRKRSKADEEYGFSSPQVTLILYRGDQPTQILFGSRTAPGDQVFLRIVGVEEIFIVDSRLLNLMPKSADEWRDRSLADIHNLKFNRITVTTGGNLIELQRGTNELWRFMDTHPMSARADTAKVEGLLQTLPMLRVNQFIDDTRPDLENFGLQPPELELTLSNDTNSVLRLQFGKSLTNDENQVFARHAEQNTIVTVSNAPLSSWHSLFENLRDRHLVAMTRPLTTIEIHANDDFSLQRQPDDGWRINPQNFIADSNFMAQFTVGLSNLQVVQFMKDVVTGPDLPQYGLDSPRYKLIVKSAGQSHDTNAPGVELDFGSTQDDHVFVRRADENTVAAISLTDFQRFPSNSWQMRDRQIWDFSADAVTNIVIRQENRERQIIRRGEHEWSLAPGSQGVVNESAIDQLLPRFTQLTAAVWSAKGETNRAQYGFKENGHRITFELKNGDQYTVEFGGDAPSQFPYATVKLDGETWIFEFPWDLYQYVLMHFTAPIIVP